VAVALRDHPAERGAADHARQAQLVAAGHEDPGGIGDRLADVVAVGVLPGQRAQPAHVGHAELVEERPIEVRRLVAERGGGRDHRDARLGTPGERGEARQDLAVTELVLRPADDEQMP
jgi:hypothetical protein